MIESKKIKNPFPGLRPFETDEYRLFFGREGQSDALIARLQRSHFLAVVGTSGSGKSSLVRAGLLPALRGGLMAGAGSGWRIAIMRPGSDPIGNLALALADKEVLLEAGGALPPAEAGAVIEATLRRGSLGLVDVARQARLAEHEKLLVVVDQFEELFRFRAARPASSTGDDASAFVKLLLEASQQLELSIYVVPTMRSDFLGDCAQFQGLPEAINDGQYLIPRMTRDERRFAISGPVGVTRGKITEPLVNRLMNDVGDNPDQLPILQHALMRTWDYWATHRRNGEPIGLEHYAAVGTMSDALSEHADEAFNELPDERSRLIAELLFKALTERGADNREIRRPTCLQDICDMANANALEVGAVIEVFRGGGRSFLMPPAGVALQPETVVDISHESLIRNWRRLMAWVKDEADSARTYRRLADAAMDYRAGARGLLDDVTLQYVLNWREQLNPARAWGVRYHPEFEAALGYLEESRVARDERIVSERERERRELETARAFAEKQARSARRMRWLAAGMAVMFLVSIVLAGSAFREKKAAVRNRVKAEAATIAWKKSSDELEKKTGELQKKSGELQTSFNSLKSAEEGRLEQTRRAKESAEVALRAEKQAKIEAANAVKQAKKAEEATKNEKVAWQTAEERRMEAERQRNIAQEQRQLAEEKTKIALSRQLSAQASNKLDNQFDLTLLLGVEAARAAPTFEARSLLRAGLNTNPELIAFLDGPKSDVHGVAFSPNGKILLSGGIDNKLRLWDVATGRPLGKPLIGDTRSIWSVAFSPDGKTVASGGFGTVALWDLTSDEPLRHHLKMDACCEYVSDLAFSPNGKTLASNNGAITLWNVETGSPQGEPMTSHEGNIRGLAFSPDGKTLASAANNTVLIWDVATHQAGVALSGQKQNIWSVAFSPDGKTLASGSDDGEILLWDIAARTHLPPLHENNWIRSLVFSKDGQSLVVGGDYGQLSRWYLSSSSFSTHFNVPKERVWTVAMSPDGESFASGSGDGSLILWHLRTGRTLARELDESSVRNLAFSPDGRILALATDNDSIRLLNTTTDLLLGEPLTGHKASAFAFSPDGTMLASVDGDSTVLLSVATRKQIGMLPTNHETLALAFSPNGKTLASGGCGKSVKKEYRGREYDKCVEGEILIWDVATGHPVGLPLTADDESIRSLVYSLDGSKLVSLGSKFNVWDVAARQSLWSDTADSVAFSPDGRTLISGSGGGNISQWDVATHHKLRDFPRLHQYEVSSVTVSPDGRMLASTSPDLFVLWDIATRQPLWSDSKPSNASFSSDSQTLATLADGRIKLWSFGLESWKERACVVANRNLTLEEWKQYFDDEPYRKTCENLPLDPSFSEEGIRLAKQGELRSAVALFRRELQLEPTLKFDPEKEARRLAAVGQGEQLLAEVDRLVVMKEPKIGDAVASYNRAVVAYAQALTFGPTPELSAASQTFNQLCWQGSLNGHAHEVLGACERAVTIDPNSWRFRDSRGLARALTGNFKGAIEDFQEFIRGTDDDVARAQRQRWINALREGKNPFTAEELETLRNP